MKFLIVRADASVQMGFGHVMRSLALAQAWKAKGGTAVLASKALPPKLQEVALASFQRIHGITSQVGSLDDANEVLSLAKSLAPGKKLAVVQDGYAFKYQYQQQISQDADTISLVVDDYGHSDRYAASFLLNNNVYANEADFKGNIASGTKLLLGPKYAFLRPNEFGRWKSWQRPQNASASKLLITIGGSDHLGLSPKFLAWLNELIDKNLEIKVLIGSASPHVSPLINEGRESRHQVTVMVDCRDVASEMAWADWAISAAGTTGLELAFMGLPALLCIVADNQVKGAQHFEKQQTAINMGSHALITKTLFFNAINRIYTDSKLRADMSASGRALVDGQGQDRVASELWDKL